MMGFTVVFSFPHMCITHCSSSSPTSFSAPSYDSLPLLKCSFCFHAITSIRAI